MSKRNIIATLTGTMILFAWQAVSWMVLPTHNDTVKYTSNQSEIMETLQKNISSSGMYAIPGVDPSKNLSLEEMEKMNTERLGKPWALVMYNTSFEGLNAANMIGGIAINLIAVILVIGLFSMSKAKEKTFAAAFGLIMIFPAFCIFQPVLQNMNWWDFPWHFIKGEVFDLVIGWMLCGSFLAWYLRKPQRT